MAHIHAYDWIEEPSPDSRSLTWVRECDCGFSPDRPSWRVIVTGSRDYTDRRKVADALDDELFHAKFLGVPMVVVQGECPHGGADLLAAEWAAVRPYVVPDPFPANWKVLGKRAGPYRNQRMVDSGGDVVLAFPLPSSTGTWDCVRRAEEAGIPVKEF